MKHLDHETIRNLIRSYFQQLLNNSDESAYLLPQDRQISIDDEIASMLADSTSLKQALVKRTYDKNASGLNKRTTA